MLDELLNRLGWYQRPNRYVKHIEHDRFEIKNGELPVMPFLKEGQYFRIVGSTFNDGLYIYPASGLVNEAFEGAIWAMAVPPSVVALASRINIYMSDGGKASAMTSESVGSYSYTKAVGADGIPLSAWDVFSSELARWRIM